MNGALVWLLENNAWPADGLPFTINLLNGHFHGVAPDWASPDPAVTVDARSCDKPNCPAVTRFGDATVKAGQLSGTAPVLYLPMQVSAQQFLLKVPGVRISGAVTDATGWIATSSGRICGDVTEDAIDPAVAEQSGCNDAMKQRVPTLVKSDIDTDGDGVRDAMSISLDFSMVDATISGVTPAPSRDTAELLLARWRFCRGKRREVANTKLRAMSVPLFAAKPGVRQDELRAHKPTPGRHGN